MHERWRILRQFFFEVYAQKSRIEFRPSWFRNQIPDEPLLPRGLLPRLYNPDMVSLETPDKPDDAATIQRMLENHAKLTDSPVAKAILADWDKEPAVPTAYAA